MHIHLSTSFERTPISRRSHIGFDGRLDPSSLIRNPLADVLATALMITSPFIRPDV
jgi:hypothetical protein